MYTYNLYLRQWKLFFFVFTSVFLYFATYGFLHSCLFIRIHINVLICASLKQFLNLNSSILSDRFKISFHLSYNHFISVQSFKLIEFSKSIILAQFSFYNSNLIKGWKVSCVTNKSRKEGWEKKWERKQLRNGFRRICMMSLITLSSVSSYMSAILRIISYLRG